MPASIPVANSQAVQSQPGGTIPFTQQWYNFFTGLGTIQTSVATASLPPATANTGMRTFVTDATATTFYSIVAGGGSNTVPVFSDGTNWRIG